MGVSATPIFLGAPVGIIAGSWPLPTLIGGTSANNSACMGLTITTRPHRDGEAFPSCLLDSLAARGTTLRAGRCQRFVRLRCSATGRGGGKWRYQPRDRPVDVRRMIAGSSAACGSNRWRCRLCADRGCAVRRRSTKCRILSTGCEGCAAPRLPVAIPRLTELNLTPYAISAVRKHAMGINNEPARPVADSANHPDG